MKHILSLIALGVVPSAAWLHAYDMYMFDPYSYHREVNYAAWRQQAPAWAASSNEYSYETRLPDLEPSSITAELSADQSTLKITGTRVIESCTCTPTVQQEVALPYRPRAEDIAISYKEGLLRLKLARHAKADAPIALSVDVVKPTSTSQDDHPVDDENGKTRPLRFIPHPSAAPESDKSDSSKDAPSSEEKARAEEKTLVEKFRGAAAAALATTTSTGSSEHAAHDQVEVSSTQPAATEAKDAA